MPKHLMRDVVVVVCALSWMVQSAPADEVLLSNGSRIVGQIESWADDQLVVVTDFAGSLMIDAGKVQGVNADRKLTIALRTGERITGLLKHDPQGGQRLLDTAFGEVSLELDSVIAVWLPDTSSPLSEPARQRDATEQIELREEHAKQTAEIEQMHQHELAELAEQLKSIAPKWGVKLDLGLNGSTGTREQLALNGRVGVKRTTESERFLAFVQARYTEQEEQRSANEIFGGTTIELDITSKWFMFGKIGLEFDEFEELDLRTTLSAGAGTFFIREQDHELKIRGGVGYQHESFMDGAVTDQGVVELGFDYMKQLASWLEFNHSSTYYPTYDDFLSDYRLVAETSAAIPLDDDKRWKVKLGMRNEYDPIPRPGVERLDTYYFLNLVYDLIR